MQECYIVPREEVHSHVVAPSNSENPSPQASKKGKVKRGLPPILFFFLGWGWWDVATHRLGGSLKRKYYL